MTHVEYMVEGAAHRLTVDGHAGSAPKGEDLVCCAVSALAQTLAQRVLDLYSAGFVLGFPVTEIHDGGVRVEATGAGDGAAILHAFETIVTGMQMLADQWPQYVQVNI